MELPREVLEDIELERFLKTGRIDSADDAERFRYLIRDISPELLLSRFERVFRHSPFETMRLLRPLTVAVNYYRRRGYVFATYYFDETTLRNVIEKQLETTTTTTSKTTSKTATTTSIETDVEMLIASVNCYMLDVGKYSHTETLVNEERKLINVTNHFFFEFVYSVILSEAVSGAVSDDFATVFETVSKLSHDYFTESILSTAKKYRKQFQSERHIVMEDNSVKILEAFRDVPIIDRDDPYRFVYDNDIDSLKSYFASRNLYEYVNDEDNFVEMPLSSGTYSFPLFAFAAVFCNTAAFKYLLMNGIRYDYRTVIGAFAGENSEIVWLTIQNTPDVVLRSIPEFFFIVSDHGSDELMQFVIQRFYEELDKYGRYLVTTTYIYTRNISAQLRADDCITTTFSMCEDYRNVLRYILRNYKHRLVESVSHDYTVTLDETVNETIRSNLRREAEKHPDKIMNRPVVDFIVHELFAIDTIHETNGEYRYLPEDHTKKSPRRRNVIDSLCLEVFQNPNEKRNRKHIQKYIHYFKHGIKLNDDVLDV